MVRSWGHRGYRRGWFGLGGADILARLGHVTFDGLVIRRAIFGGILVGEPWPRCEVASLDGCQPSCFDWEAGRCVKVADQGFDDR